ncbi:TRAP transporter small permease [uncultured Dysosmobacter sp.]|uniref:TRAP transporter small permease n=1 Tax=uncultured Dysosmobacter sp. TaxID=2591384 RepID=UPI00262683AA|nr:TRAP transporter small permease [uncultured Dysosmobacter sp.]
MKQLTKCCNVLEKVCLDFAIVLLVVVTLLTFAETVLRYSFHTSLKYTQEIVTYAMPWIAFVGGAVAWRRSALVNIDVLGKAPQWLKMICAFLGQLLVLFLLVLTVKSGVLYAMKNLKQLSPAMQVSVSWCYASIPVGCIFMILFSIEKVLSAFLSPKAVKEGPEV